MDVYCLFNPIDYIIIAQLDKIGLSCGDEILTENISILRSMQNWLEYRVSNLTKSSEKPCHIHSSLLLRFFRKAVVLFLPIFHTGCSFVITKNVELSNQFFSCTKDWGFPTFSRGRLRKLTSFGGQMGPHTKFTTSRDTLPPPKLPPPLYHTTTMTPTPPLFSSNIFKLLQLFLMLYITSHR